MSREGQLKNSTHPQARPALLRFGYERARTGLAWPRRALRQISGGADNQPCLDQFFAVVLALSWAGLCVCVLACCYQCGRAAAQRCMVRIREKRQPRPRVLVPLFQPATERGANARTRASQCDTDHDFFFRLLLFGLLAVSPSPVLLASIPCRVASSPASPAPASPAKGGAWAWVAGGMGAWVQAGCAHGSWTWPTPKIWPGLGWHRAASLLAGPLPTDPVSVCRPPFSCSACCWWRNWLAPACPAGQGSWRWRSLVGGWWCVLAGGVVEPGSSLLGSHHYHHNHH